MVRPVGVGKKITVGFDVCFLLRRFCIVEVQLHCFLGPWFIYLFIRLRYFDRRHCGRHFESLLAYRSDNLMKWEVLAQVRKKDGSDYEPDSLRVISASL